MTFKTHMHIYKNVMGTFTYQNHIKSENPGDEHYKLLFLRTGLNHLHKKHINYKTVPQEWKIQQKCQYGTYKLTHKFIQGDFPLQTTGCKTGFHTRQINSLHAKRSYTESGSRQMQSEDPRSRTTYRNTLKTCPVL